MQARPNDKAEPLAAVRVHWIADSHAGPGRGAQFDAERLDAFFDKTEIARVGRPVGHAGSA